MLSLIGSTGSIGRQTLQVLERLGQQPVALVAMRNVKELEAQCRRHHPKIAVLADENSARDLRIRLADTGIHVYGGDDAVCDAAIHPEADTTLIAATGLAGLKPVLVSIGTGRRILLANKESMVYAGQLIMNRIKSTDTLFLPIDSELSAIYQCIEVAPFKDVKKITLTASGGPFFGRSFDSLRNVTLDEALKHPTWNMGRKISIDSATMLNKGYEVFETMHYFNVPVDAISVLIHRESIVHSIVQFAYGATFFHMAVPDMSLPIQYALTYPDRFQSFVKHLDLAAVSTLTFAQVDLNTFPCLELSMNAARHGGLAGAVLATAGEVAVERFIAGTLSFTGISKCVEKALTHIPDGNPMSIDDIMSVDSEIRALCRE